MSLAREEQVSIEGGKKPIELGRFANVEKASQKIHDEAIEGMKERYVVVAPGSGKKYYLMYHDYGKLGIDGEKEGMGHVAGVVATQKLYVRGVEITGKDSWGLFSRTEGVEASRDEIITAFVGSGVVHDLGNVAVATELAWKKREGDESGRVWGVKFFKMRSLRAEEIEAGLIGDCVEANAEEWGIGGDDGKKRVGDLGARMILRTTFTPDFKHDGVDNDKSTIALAAVDQVGAAMFNPNSLLAVFGLVKEKMEDLDVKEGKFKPEGFFGGFIPWRFEQLEKLLGSEANMANMIGFFDAVRKNDPGEFADILGVEGDDRKRIAELGSLDGMVRKNLTIQTEVARMFWPQEEVEFSRAFEGWDDDKLELMAKACELYKKHFWEEGYTVEQLKKELQPS